MSRPQQRPKARVPRVTLDDIHAFPLQQKQLLVIQGMTLNLIDLDDAFMLKPRHPSESTIIKAVFDEHAGVDFMIWPGYKQDLDTSNFEIGGSGSCSPLTAFLHYSTDESAFKVGAGAAHGVFISEDLLKSIPEPTRPEIDKNDARRVAAFGNPPYLEAVGSVDLPFFLIIDRPRTRFHYIMKCLVLKGIEIGMMVPEKYFLGHHTQLKYTRFDIPAEEEPKIEQSLTWVPSTLLFPDSLTSTNGDIQLGSLGFVGDPVGDLSLSRVYCDARLHTSLNVHVISQRLANKFPPEMIEGADQTVVIASPQRAVKSQSKIRLEWHQGLPPYVTRRDYFFVLPTSSVEYGTMGWPDCYGMYGFDAIISRISMPPGWRMMD